MSIVILYLAPNDEFRAMSSEAHAKAQRSQECKGKASLFAPFSCFAFLARALLSEFVTRHSSLLPSATKNALVPH
jgi:hypothetical protein